MRTSRRWIACTLVVLAIHFAWEMGQARWFASMRGLPIWPATLLCLRAALGDLLITAAAFCVAAIAVKRIAWPDQRRLVIPAALFIITGLAITIAFERFAIATGRWSYEPRMPTLFGIGLAPLLEDAYMRPYYETMKRAYMQTQRFRKRTKKDEPAAK
jgi:hypothetical protein